jgi:hypothetical protein
VKYLFIYWISIDCTISIEKFDSCDFIKKHLNKFFIQMNISVLKKIFCWKITFIWKMTRIMLLESLCIKIHFISLSKCYMKSKKNYPQDIPRYTPKKTFSCLKRPPPAVVCFHKFPLFHCVFILEFSKFGGVVSSFIKSLKSSLRFSNASSTTTIL